MIPCDPRPPRAARKRQESVDLYVSKLGDDSDGSSWQHAFATIQAGLCAVPDDKGAHRVIVRPDAYQEPNIYATHKGAAGRYNELVGDFDGSFGSGTSTPPAATPASCSTGRTASSRSACSSRTA